MHLEVRAEPSKFVVADVPVCRADEFIELNELNELNELIELVQFANLRIRRVSCASSHLLCAIRLHF